tara:strand:+ start:374 stop:814 length:441 start_codon:yes stop_codon:yes gene_type:complete
MTSQTLGIIIGGIVPGILFGVSNALVKLATQKGISLPLYMLVTGIAVITVSVILLFLLPDREVSKAAVSVTFLGGMLWATGASCIVIALQMYAAPISVLAPLLNLSALVAVVLGLWLFAEWKTVQVPQLLLGSVLIVLGGALVARA